MDLAGYAVVKASTKRFEAAAGSYEYESVTFMEVYQRTCD